MADLVLRSPQGPRILIYHQVGVGLGREMEVTQEAFRRQLAWLIAEREIVGLEEAIARWSELDAERLVVLTFDDGYRDTFETAFPMLAEHGLPFTLYLATESVETGQSLGPEAMAEPLTWDQIEEMRESRLLTIGAHTHRHTDLRHSSSQEVEEELATSDRLLKERLGIEVVHFAYPWGYWSAQADPIVRRRYGSAVLGGSPLSSRPPDPHLIRRFPVQLSDGFAFFRRRLEGGLRLEEQVRRLIRGYSGP